MRLRVSVFIGMVAAAPLFAADVTVVATVDSQSITIGDWIHLALEVRHPSGLTVRLPVLRDTLGAFEIVHQDSAETRAEGPTTVVSKSYVISNYTPGNFYVPPVAVRFVLPDGTPDSALSNPIPVEVRGIQVDTSQSIRDIKSPLRVPMSAGEIALYVGLALAAAGAAYGVYYYLRKKRRPIDVMQAERPVIPPHIEAMQKLYELDEQHLWQSGAVKEFYSKATEIVREYFEKRYGIMALEMTTGEVMEQLAVFKLDTNIVETIVRFLSEADLVKFAKYQPVATENETVIPAAQSIVERTRPPEVSAATTEAEGGPSGG